MNIIKENAKQCHQLSVCVWVCMRAHIPNNGHRWSHIPNNGHIVVCLHNSLTRLMVCMSSQGLTYLTVGGSGLFKVKVHTQRCNGEQSCCGQSESDHLDIGIRNMQNGSW